MKVRDQRTGKKRLQLFLCVQHARYAVMQRKENQREWSDKIKQEHEPEMSPLPH